jgi:hypothetical protein
MARHVGSATVWSRGRLFLRANWSRGFRRWVGTFRNTHALSGACEDDGARHTFV